MKKCINWMVAASVLAIGLVGCNRDNPNGVGQDEVGQTKFELKLEFPANEMPTEGQQDETRATADGNAIEAETAIKHADVYIYSGNGDFLSRVRLEAATFTQVTPGATGADTWTSSTAMSITTGDKFFHVGINIPLALATSLEGKPMASARSEIQTFARTDYNPVATTGLPMFSTGAVAATMQQDATLNKVTIPVKRMVSKITVQRAPTVTQSGTAGYIGPMSWAVNNVNTKAFFVQGVASAYADPNWADTAYDATQFSQATDTDYVAVNNSDATTATYNARYAIENTSDKKLNKEMNRITVRAQFAPQTWVASGGYQNGTLNRTANPNYNTTTPASSTFVTFYTVRPNANAQTEYFENQNDAQSYATANGAPGVNTYTTGYCYWNIYVNNSRRGEMLRNDYYKIQITSVVAPGNSTPDLTNPESPTTTNTTVTATVNILYWNAVLMEDRPLEP